MFQIENQCIESLAWANSSPLWRTMENINYRVPTAQEVESSTDLSGITPHKPGDSVTKINGQLKLGKFWLNYELNVTLVRTMMDLMNPPQS